MEDLISYFKVKKNLVNLLILAILVAGLPIGIQLARQQQIIKSYAKEATVEFLTGQCVTNRGNNQVATCKDPINVRITAPFSPAGVGAQSLKVTSASSKNLISSIPQGGVVGTVFADDCDEEGGDWCHEQECSCNEQCGECDGECSANVNTPGMCGNPEECTSNCDGEQCGQDDGCGEACPDTDANTPGMCGNAADCTNICENFASDECGNLSEPPSECGGDQWCTY